MKTNRFLPEGYRRTTVAQLPFALIEQLQKEGEILEGRVSRCDAKHNLHVTFAGYDGIIPRAEAISPLLSGADKEISVLSRVGHMVSFLITDIDIDGSGKPVLYLSRRKAQETALEHLKDTCPIGTVCRGCVTHLERFGAFVDIGCGIPALLPLEYISVARINHPRERLRTGQKILCIMKDVDEAQTRFTVSHKELLGTWMENAALFAPGETVTGNVRGIKDYGIFVELTPNLSGLAEYQEGLEENDTVSVYIKSIRPEQMKIKLQIIQKIDPIPITERLDYFITDGYLQQWQYAPPGCEKNCEAITFS